MQIPRKPFTRLAPFTVAACLVVAAGCDAQAGEASQPAELDGATTLSGLVTAKVRATDFTALARSLNPIVDTGGGGCSSTRATIDTVEYSDVAVAVAPTASGSDTRITVLAPVLRGQLQYRLLCLTFRTTFTVRADAYEVDGLVVSRIESGKLAVAFASPTARSPVSRSSWQASRASTASSTSSSARCKDRSLAPSRRPSRPSSRR
ncbi:MAG TPA: hypothetical protein VHT91_21760 [Kofleriaceae bacterium]|nr:hypothetical protein [Kofleriaceae bacterium]